MASPCAHRAIADFSHRIFSLSLGAVPSQARQIGIGQSRLTIYSLTNKINTTLTVPDRLVDLRLEPSSSGKSSP